MASPSTLSAADRAKVRELLSLGYPERAGLRLDEVKVASVRPETRLSFNSPVRVMAWTLTVRAQCRDGRNYAGDIELFQWPEEGWELVHDGLSHQR